MTPGPRRFQTTHWSLVLTAADHSGAQARSALSALCEAYWHPVYAFIRRTVRSEDDARDLTQAFFTRVIERRYLRAASPERGRFRSFLLTAVRHFLADERDHRRALKRGGGVPHVAIGPAPMAGEPAADPQSDETPEQIYERQWALAALDAAVGRLRADYDRSGRRAVFELLRPAIDGDARVDYGDLARSLGRREGAVRVAVHRLRRHVGASLRAAIAETVADAGDVDDELRFLMSVLGRR
jgi:RNA polymerase sigma-70 factor (ECF subfamily)